MKKLQKQQLAFLEETVEYYSADPVGRRAIGNYGCVYLTEDGRKCAIGRHIPESRYNPSMMGDVTELLTDFPKALPMRILNLDLDFLQSVQDLHDTESFWNTKGLTELGESRVERIKNLYRLKH